MSTRRQPDPVCPWCGYVLRDVYDILGAGFCDEDDSTIVECGQCEREYVVVVHMSTSYSTRKPEATEVLAVSSPSLRVVGTCNGCEAYAVLPGDVPMDAVCLADPMRVVDICEIEHEDADVATPAWCPVLVAAERERAEAQALRMTAQHHAEVHAASTVFDRERERLIERCWTLAGAVSTVGDWLGRGEPLEEVLARLVRAGCVAGRFWCEQPLARMD